MAVTLADAEPAAAALAVLVLVDDVGDEVPMARKRPRTEEDGTARAAAAGGGLGGGAEGRGEADTVALSAASWVRVERGVLHVRDHDEWDALWALRPTEPQYVRLFGKDVEVPRRQALLADCTSQVAAYRFSGTAVPSQPLADAPLARRALELVRAREEEERRASLYNAVFVNWYEEGGRIGPHSDDERDLVQGANIYSFTLMEPGAGGTPRRLVFTPKKRKGGPEPPPATRAIDMEDGTLVVMGGATQGEWKHAVPHRARDRGRRINLTVRAFRVEPG